MDKSFDFKEQGATITKEEYELLTELIQDEERLEVYGFRAMQKMKELMNENVEKTYRQRGEPSVLVECSGDLEFRPIKVYEDGRRYFGQWNKVTTLREGTGISTNLNDHQFVIGQFSSDKCTGKGLYIFSNGSYYEGDLKDLYAHGYGKIVSKKGFEYEGQWENDLWHGLGTEVECNGDVYRGEFVRHEREGEGVLVDKSGVRYEGEFRSGKKHGYGVQVDCEKTEFYANFEYDLVEGLCWIVKMDGAMFRGKWDVEDEMTGIYTDTKGRELKVPSEISSGTVHAIFNLH
ncbi:unnamed protein product [Moneuplotes crassus]|uniref:Uncharacterized protein n=2 Tax=Euplotes crassus TaxID=5936 RepID=A0AAD1XR63_EUPCR|nr:unnamed protein product [Moneuplotes crassus]